MSASRNGRLNDRPAMQWYTGDYLSSGKVQRMDWAEKGVYVHLLNRLWEAGGWLADTPDDLADALGCDPEEVPSLVTDRVRRCFVFEDGKLASPRMLRELEHADAYREAMSEAGRRSAAKRQAKAAPPSKAPKTAIEANQAQPGSNLVQPGSTKVQPGSTPNPTQPNPSQPSKTPQPPTAPEPEPPPKPRAAAPAAQARSARGGRAKVAAWDQLLAPGGEFERLRGGPFWAMLEVWTEHLAARLSKAHTLVGARTALRKIETMGPVRFGWAVEHSTAGNYQALVEPDRPRAGRPVGTVGEQIAEQVRTGALELVPAPTEDFDWRKADRERRHGRRA
ncbi:DUF1376 domain-containing protein [Engelhardtia mirabilis]|uniref:DUF1376 domain-containing protein n=1 Tax=Engelhardtia mirabilis TaxID=2528011 RepID=A0A518BL17_9BACT|nr:hypothetical protein Pla133_27460 [Planctomycetes bacterium Pla133]QDV01984.1 hypothetical protein Pla86_27450 [Planctomycetes bacterium Pla86]